MNNLGNSSLSNCVNISYIQAVPPIAPVLYAINPNPTFTGQIEVIWGVPVQGATSYFTVSEYNHYHECLRFNACKYGTDWLPWLRKII